MSTTKKHVCNTCARLILTGDVTEAPPSWSQRAAEEALETINVEIPRPGFQHVCDAVCCMCQQFVRGDRHIAYVTPREELKLPSKIDHAEEILEHADLVGNGSDEVLKQLIVARIIERDELPREFIPETIFGTIELYADSLEFDDVVISRLCTYKMRAIEIDGTTYDLDEWQLTKGINAFITKTLTTRATPDPDPATVLTAYDMRAERWEQVTITEKIARAIIEATVMVLRTED